MKLGAVTKLDKRNTSTSKIFDDYEMSTNCDVIAFYPIFSKCAAIRKPDSGCKVYKTCVFINSNPYSTKPENRTKKSLTQLLYYCFE